jgi:hypothetical protein
MENKIVEVIAEGDSLFGKAFKFVKQVGEFVFVEIEAEGRVIEAVFHQDHVQATITNKVLPTTTAAEVAVSGVVLKAPADTSSDPVPMNPPSGAGAPAETAASDPNKVA